MGIILTGKKILDHTGSFINGLRHDIMTKTTTRRSFFKIKVEMAKLDPNHPDLDSNIREKRLT